MTDNPLSHQRAFEEGFAMDSINNNLSHLEANDVFGVTVDNSQILSYNGDEFSVGDTVTNVINSNTNSNENRFVSSTNEHIVISGGITPTDNIKSLFPLGGISGSASEDNVDRRNSISWESLIQNIEQGNVGSLGSKLSSICQSSKRSSNVTDEGQDCNNSWRQVSLSLSRSSMFDECELERANNDETGIMRSEITTNWGMSPLSRPKYPVVCCRAARYATGTNKRPCNKNAMCYHRHKEVEGSCRRPEAVEVAREVWHLCVPLKDFREYYESREKNFGNCVDDNIVAYGGQQSMSDNEWYRTLPCEYGLKCTNKEHKQNAFNRLFDNAARADYSTYINEELKKFEAILIMEKHPDFEQQRDNRNDKGIYDQHAPIIPFYPTSDNNSFLFNRHLANSDNNPYNIHHHQQSRCFSYKHDRRNMHQFLEYSPTNGVLFGPSKIPVEGLRSSPIDQLHASHNSSAALSYSSNLNNHLTATSLLPPTMMSTYPQFNPPLPYIIYSSSGEQRFTSPPQTSDRFQCSTVTNNSSSNIASYHNNSTTKQRNQESPVINLQHTKDNSIDETTNEESQSDSDDDSLSGTQKVITQSWLAAAAKPDDNGRTVKGRLYTKRECLVMAVEQARQCKRYAAVAWNALGDHMKKDEQQRVVCSGTNIMVSKGICYAMALEIQMKINMTGKGILKDKAAMSVTLVKLGKFLISTADKGQRSNTQAVTNPSVKYPKVVGVPVVVSGKEYNTGLECFIDAITWNNDNINAWSELCNFFSHSSATVNGVTINGCFYTAADCENKVLSLSVGGNATTETATTTNTIEHIYDQSQGQLLQDCNQSRNNEKFFGIPLPGDYVSRNGRNATTLLKSNINNNNYNLTNSSRGVIDRDSAQCPVINRMSQSLPIPMPSSLCSELHASCLDDEDDDLGLKWKAHWTNGKEIIRKSVGRDNAQRSTSRKVVNKTMRPMGEEEEEEDSPFVVSNTIPSLHQSQRRHVYSYSKLTRPLTPPGPPQFQPYKMFPPVKCCHADLEYGRICRYKSRCYHLHKDPQQDSVTDTAVMGVVVYIHLQIKLSEERFAQLPCEFGIHCQNLRHRQCAIDTGFDENQRGAYFRFIKCMRKYENELIKYHRNARNNYSCCSKLLSTRYCVENPHSTSFQEKETVTETDGRGDSLSPSAPCGDQIIIEEDIITDVTSPLTVSDIAANQ